MTRQKWLCIVFVVFIAGVSLVNWLTPSTDFSESENRSLQTFPEVNTEKVFSGEFSQEFESYANDQFLLRDGWVGLKTLASLAIGKKDNGRVFFGKDGYLLEMDSVLNQQQLSANAEALGAFMAYAKQQNPALNLAVLMAPTAAGVMTEKLPTRLTRRSRRAKSCRRWRLPTIRRRPSNRCVPPCLKAWCFRTFCLR